MEGVSRGLGEELEIELASVLAHMRVCVMGFRGRVWGSGIRDIGI